jgi:dihydroorotate dehydrogenase electron transfer subunit
MGFEIKPSLGNINPGQFIHVKLTSHCEPLLRRPFSIFNVFETKPNEPSVVEIVYHVVGKGTHLMAEMKTGTKVDIMGPLGNGYTINNNADTSIVIGGGIGIAGINHLLKILKSGNNQVIALLGIRSKEELQIAELLKASGAKTMISTDDGSYGKKGFVTDLLRAALKRQFSIHNSKFSIQLYACGPKGMTDAVCKIAVKEKIPCQVSLEQWMGCGIGICRACVCRMKKGKEFYYSTVCSNGPVFEASQIYLEPVEA